MAMFARFRHRSHELERQDTGDFTPQEFAKWQNEMRLIHRVFGEVRALRTSLFREIEETGDRRTSVLDVGAGSGDLLTVIKKWVSGRKIFLAGVELNTAAASSIRVDGIAAVQCDALHLPFADDSFDYVTCSLLLHHFPDETAIELLREMSRVAARRIFVIDLHRTPAAYYFYRVISRIIFQQFTQDDGALSILRSFHPDELRQLAARAGLQDVKVSRSAVYRLVLTGS